jgi:hypothetical protein
LVHAMPKNEIKSERRRQPRSMQGWVYRGGGLCSASKIWGLPVEDLESGRRFCSAASRGGGLELTVQGEHSSVKRKKMNIEFIDIPFLNLKNMNQNLLWVPLNWYFLIETSWYFLVLPPLD